MQSIATKALVLGVGGELGWVMMEPADCSGGSILGWQIECLSSPHRSWTKRGEICFLRRFRHFVFLTGSWIPRA